MKHFTRLPTGWSSAAGCDLFHKAWGDFTRSGSGINPPQISYEKLEIRDYHEEAFEVRFEFRTRAEALFYGNIFQQRAEAHENTDGFVPRNLTFLWEYGTMESEYA